MPAEKKYPKYPRKRPNSFPVMLSDEEKSELRRAADAAGMALSVFPARHGPRRR